MQNKKTSKNSGIWLLTIGLLLSPFMFAVGNVLFTRDTTADGGFTTLITIVGGFVSAVVSIVCIALGIARLYSKQPSATENVGRELGELSEVEVTQLKHNLFALSAVTVIVGIILAFSLFMLVKIMGNLDYLQWIFLPIFVPAAIITAIIFVRNCIKIKHQRRAIVAATSKKLT